MIDLLKEFTVVQIATILVGTAVSLKLLLAFWDWAYERISKHFNKQASKDKEKERLEERLRNGGDAIYQLTLKQNELAEQIVKMAEKLDLLIQSDKDDIKAYITEKYHYYCDEQGWIDDYTLECCEKRFEHYKAEGGNSFVETLMNEIRSLPKRPPQN